MVLEEKEVASSSYRCKTVNNQNFLVKILNCLNDPLFWERISWSSMFGQPSQGARDTSTKSSLMDFEQ